MRKILIVAALAAVGLALQTAVLVECVARPLDGALRALHGQPPASSIARVEEGGGEVARGKAKRHAPEINEKKAATSGANPAERRTSHQPIAVGEPKTPDR